MDRDRQLPTRALLVRVPHQADKNKGEEQGREKIKGAVLVAGDAIIGAPLLAGQFQIDLAVAGDVADVAVLENLQPGTQCNDDAAANALGRLSVYAERRLGRVVHRQDVEHAVQIFLRVQGEQLIDLADVFPIVRIPLIYIQDQRLEQIHLCAVPKVVAPLIPGVFDYDVTEKLGHEFLSPDLSKAVPGVGTGRGHKIEYLHDISLAAQVVAGLFI